MTAQIARRLADMLLGLLLVTAPPRLRVWVDAIREEASHIPDGNDALWFVAASAPGLLGTFLSVRSAELRKAAAEAPRVLAALAASGAVAVGAVHMAVAGAPPGMLMVNGLALVLGLLALAI